MLNALSAVTWEDLIKQRMNKVSEEKATTITKLLGILQVQKH